MTPKWAPVFSALLFPLLLVKSDVTAEDWPMWRCNAQRTAATTGALPPEFRVLWQKDLQPRNQVWDDPLNLDLMSYDRVFEPVVVGNRLFLSFNDRDKVSAFDTDTGAELWSAFADAPVRLPPVGTSDAIFFCSDDGFLYCVDPVTGKLRWKFDGAPNRQQAIGNQRLTSAWPARGGPVVRDGTVYFAASIWPFMGTFLYALDADSGEVSWVNDSTGSQYIKQPHSAPSFAGVAPQGALVATKDLLLVPGGRSVPAVFSRSDGSFRYFEINAGGKGNGGSFVSADEKHFYVHTREKGTRAFHLTTGVKTSFTPTEPVLHEGQIYSAETDKEKSVIRAYDQKHERLWEIEADGTGDLILVGNHLVAAGKEEISIIALPVESKTPTVITRIATEDPVQRLVAADDKIFAVTAGGKVTAYGQHTNNEDRESVTSVSQVSAEEEPKQPVAGDEVIDELLALGDPSGYAFWFGDCESPQLAKLIRKSPFEQLAIMDDDSAAVERQRLVLDQQQRYGKITVHVGGPQQTMLPSHVGNMVFLEHDASHAFDPSAVQQLYKSVRPYGGVLHILAGREREQIAAEIEELDLEQARVQIHSHGVSVIRVGALPGAADWTHQYGDVANSIKSDDRRVKLPLGVLWFGGSSNMDVLPRHGHGPPEQVIGGRLYIQGMNSLSARDVYTGRVLWKREFKDLGTNDVYYDSTYDNTPLDTKYNQVHIPGANGRGTNYVVTEDRVYIVEGSVCHVLDSVTGADLKDIKLPSDGDTAEPQWGYIGIYKDVLIAGFDFASYRKRLDLSFESDEKLKKNREGFGSKSLDRAASRGLIAFDRHRGDVLWRIDARHSFWHNGIVAGGDQIYCLDRNPAPVEEALKRRGKLDSSGNRILAVDYLSGKIKWEFDEDVFGSWLGYSEKHDLLLQAGAAASDRLSSEVGQGMAVHSTTDGSVRWKKSSLKYTGPCILHNDLIITNTNSYAESAGAFYLLDGSQKMVPNPITGQMQPWKITRAYGCNNIVASENLLTFRSGAAGYYDLQTNAGTGNLGGFKSGCTSNLVVANGVLNAPDYTRTCSCAYQNQTSLALVHMPEVELWSVNTAASVKTHGERIERVGINLGAAGDRRDTQGLLWLEYPATAGPSPPLKIRWNDDVDVFTHHASVALSSEHPWVMSSGLDGITSLKIAMQLRDEYSLQKGIPVEHVNDDAIENASGVVDLVSEDLEFSKASGNQILGLRFNDIRMYRDSVIRDAYIEFASTEPGENSAELTISVEDSGNAKGFAKAERNLSSRKFSKESVSWNPKSGSGQTQKWTTHRTPDLASLVHSVIERKDWKPGNSIAFLLSVDGDRKLAAYSKSGQNHARLIIDAEAKVDDAPVNEPYRLRLFFGGPEIQVSDRRVFDVFVQNKLVLSDVTIDSSTDEAQSCVHVVNDIQIGEELDIRFQAKQGKPVLSGLELIRQNPDE